MLSHRLPLLLLHLVYAVSSGSPLLLHPVVLCYFLHPLLLTCGHLVLAWLIFLDISSSAAPHIDR